MSSSAGGLSRRRVAASSSSSPNPTSAGDDPPPPTRTTSSASTPTAEPESARRHGGTAMEGGSRVAFDPRDLAEEEDKKDLEGGSPPLLTILEEVLLLGLKDKQGYLSFWNDNISYALRGCILIELALRRRIQMSPDPSRRRFPLPDRLIEAALPLRLTGEPILDEALKLIASTPERMGVGSWVDLMSGETWNVLKIGFQLKQVRERLAKGLVDKGVLRTEKRNFLLFDMATHPVADPRAKEAVVGRVVALLGARTTAVPPEALGSEGTQARAARSVALVCAAYAASVLDNALARMGYEEREDAFGRCDDILSEFAVWPLGGGAAASTGRKREGSGSRSGGKEAVFELVREVKKEMRGEDDLCFEVVATVFEVFSRMDSLL